ncbi:hypothetical protein [Sphingomonas solaris]|uniref:hypothetical protein n=1 Tax=Alterirhizorhabdus solaris TaxID=2529389 RepID=UPI001EF15936|nr:hypothetical protein [Sphingomonas solaris]
MRGIGTLRLAGTIGILLSGPAVAAAVDAPVAAAVSSPVAVTSPAEAAPPPLIATLRPAPAAGEMMVLPANTEFLLTLDRDLNSKKIRQGETFPLIVTSDVMLGDYVVIPRGTPATGEVTYRTGKGAFGKSAKMEIDLRSIDLSGRHIPIQGHYREEGSGNTGATVGTAVAAGPFAVFVTGRSAIFRQGRELRVKTSEDIQVALAR